MKNGAAFCTLAVLLALACGCTKPIGKSNGKDLAVLSPDGSAAATLNEVLQRGNENSLKAPFTVFFIDQQAGARIPLYTLSWSKGTDGLSWEAAKIDKVLDRAEIKILSTDGMSPFYDYCFNDGNHADVATNFCTKTLISAMKAYRKAKAEAAGAPSAPFPAS